MFSAPFTSAFATVPHSSQTYNPHSTRFASRVRPQLEHDFDVSRSHTSSTVIPSISSFILEEIGESVERPRVEVEVAVFPPVFHLTILIFTDTGQASHHNRPNTFLDASLNDVFRKCVEIVSAPPRLFLVQPGGLLRVGVVAASNPLAEVVVVLLQAVQRVQLAVAVLVGECSKVVDAEIDTNGLLTWCVGHVDLDVAQEVQFPLVPRPNGPHLLDVFHGGEINVGSGLVLTEDEVRPVLFEVRAF